MRTFTGREKEGLYIRNLLKAEMGVKIRTKESLNIEKICHRVEGRSDVIITPFSSSNAIENKLSKIA